MARPVTIKPEVTSSVVVEGHKNPIIAAVEEKQIPFKAIGYVRVPGTNHYSSYVIHLKGTKVVKIVFEEPNLKMIAEDTCKVSFVEQFMQQE